MKIQFSQDAFINSTNISEHLLPGRRSSRCLRYRCERTLSPALAELTLLCYLRWAPWQVYTPGRRHVVGGDGHDGRAPTQAFLGTVTHAWYVLAAVLKTTQRSKAVRPCPLEAYRTEEGVAQDEWSSTYSRDRGSGEKKPKSPPLEETERGWAETEP